MSLSTFFTFGAIAISSLASQANAHMTMQNPVPFGLGSLDNSPLLNLKPGAQNSDFPCKIRSGVYDVTAMNYMTVGKPNLLNFKGSATHGGGTCQLSISKDFNPTATSTFKLIQTFEGGCPSASVGSTNPEDFSFTLPEGTPSGNLSLQWYVYKSHPLST